MPLLTEYQELILKSLKRYPFGRILRMKGKCHDALIGEWVNWWLKRKIDGMIFNPARGSKSGSRRYVADLMFLERFIESEYFEVKGIAEIENNEEKLSEKTNSLVSYENYSKQGGNVY